MTVGVDEELRIREYPGDDSATPRAYGFKILDPDDLRVTRTDADGAETVLVRGTHYTVSGAGNPTGGDVTPLAPIAAGTSWRIEGDMALGQPTDYTAGDDFPAESHERGLDRSMIAHQEARRDINDTRSRAPLYPRGETADPIPPADQRANRFLGYDAVGRAVAMPGTGADEGLRAALADPDIGGRLGAFKAAPSARTRDIDTVLRDRRVSILEFYQAGDAGDIAPAIGRAIDEDVGRLLFPPFDLGYDIKTSVARTLTFDLDIDFNGQPVTGVGSINLAAPAISVGTLTAASAAGARSITVTDASDLLPGDVVNMQSSVTVATNYALENKNETVRVLRTVGNTVHLTRPLRFAWDPGAPQDATLSVVAFRQVRLKTRAINYRCPQEQGDGDTLRMIYTEGVADIVHEQPVFIGRDDGFDTESNIYRAGVIHYYADSGVIRDGYYERMSYPTGWYASGSVVETARGYHNHHTSADLGNWSQAYQGHVDDEGSFSAWSSHMCHFYKIAGRCEGQEFLPAIRALGCDRSGLYETYDATSNTAESDPGPLEAAFQYLWSAPHATKDWHDFDLRAPNRAGRSVRIVGARKVSFRNFSTDQREIALYPDVALAEIGVGCNFGGGIAPQTWNGLTLGTSNVRVLTSDVRDAYLDGGRYHIDPRREAAPQSGKVLRCRGAIFRKDGGGAARTVRIHLNAFFGINPLFFVGKLTLRGTVQHQSSGLYSAIEQDYDFLAYVGGGATFEMSATPTSERGPTSGAGGPDIDLTLTNIALVDANYLQFDVTPTLSGGVTSPNFAVDYVLEMKETNA